MIINSQTNNDLVMSTHIHICTLESCLGDAWRRCCWRWLGALPLAPTHQELANAGNNIWRKKRTRIIVALSYSTDSQDHLESSFLELLSVELLFHCLIP